MGAIERAISIADAAFADCANAAVGAGNLCPCERDARVLVDAGLQSCNLATERTGIEWIEIVAIDDA